MNLIFLHSHHHNLLNIQVRITQVNRTTQKKNLDSILTRSNLRLHLS